MARRQCTSPAPATNQIHPRYKTRLYAAHPTRKHIYGKGGGGSRGVGFQSCPRQPENSFSGRGNSSRIHTDMVGTFGKEKCHLAVRNTAQVPEFTFPPFQREATLEFKHGRWLSQLNGQETRNQKCPRKAERYKQRQNTWRNGYPLLLAYPTRSSIPLYCALCITDSVAESVQEIRGAMTIVS